jgi:hypothetical protein
MCSRPSQNSLLGYPNPSLKYLNGGSFLFVLPSFYEEGLKKERTEEWKEYHDNLYLGFTALDNVTNYECSRKYNSGWWYPNALKFDSYDYSIKESCTYHPLNGTNLNGVFDDLNPNQTTRTIAFCSRNDVKECIKPKYNKQTCCSNGKCGDCVIGWEYTNIKTFKLRSTKMWLKRKV